MPQPRLILLHSPLVGPSFWRDACDALWARGARAYTPRLPAAEHVHPPYWLTHAAGVAAGLPEQDEVVLVGHGAAGALLPAVGRLARNREPCARIAGYLFVDCELPRDGASRLDLLDTARAEALRAACRSGWLPGWDEAELVRLLPDPDGRRRFAAEQPRTPLALFDEPVRVPDDWPEAPCAYLALSDACAGSAARAAAEGWPKRELAGHALLAVTHPELVASAVLDLVACLRG